MTKKQNIKCLFGYHNYTIPDKIHSDILICKHCKRFGYWKGVYEFEMWCEYNEQGNMIHWKNSTGFEVWYNEKGDMVHRKCSNGYEAWYDKKGNVIKTKEVST